MRPLVILSSLVGALFYWTLRREVAPLTTAEAHPVLLMAQDYPLTLTTPK